MIFRIGFVPLRIYLCCTHMHTHNLYIVHCLPQTRKYNIANTITEGVCGLRTNRIYYVPIDAGSFQLPDDDLAVNITC